MRAWIICVAGEHYNWRSVSPGTDAPDVSFITPVDAYHALYFHVQRRAKLGRLSLLQILNEFEFHASEKVAIDMLLPILRQAALEPQERPKVSKYSSALEIVRRISRERSSSPSFRGRRSRRSS
jgi:hypothetical protein